MAAAEETVEGLPAGYEPVPHQVAGHMYKDGKHGMLRQSGGSTKQLYKPVQCPPKGQREVDFYKAINESDGANAPCSEFGEWIPRSYGIKRLSDEMQYIVLEDLAAPYDNPSVMDIKIGKRCWDNFATDEKIRTERAKYPPQATIGYRIGGIRRFVAEQQAYREKGKVECLALDEQGVLDSLNEFFAGCRPDLEFVIEQLRVLLTLFETQTAVHFFSSSLLFIFGTPSSSPDKRREQPRPCVRMIDFAHAYLLSEEAASVDENYLFGLRNLIDTLSDLL